MRHKLQDGSDTEREERLALAHLSTPEPVPAPGSLLSANASESALRMAVRLRMTLPENERILAITSPSTRDFASELAVGLATAFSQTEQGEVVLVSATQGSPTSVLQDSGLGEVLSGACGLPAAISHPRASGPFVLSRGWLPPNPVSLFTAPECAQLFAALRERFRVVIVDAGPVSSAAAMALIARCDAVALAVAKGLHRRRELIEVQEELARLKTRPLGVILTGDKR